MIYDKVLSTGDSTISGCSSAQLHTNIFNSGNIKAAGTRGIFFYDRELVTGQTNIQLSMGGQTLLEEVPITGQAVNSISYQNKTGDFFIKGQEADTISRSKLYFSKTTPVKSNYKLNYQVITGGNFAATGDLGNSLRGSIRGGIGTSAVFSHCDYFLNGQKVYSGVGVGVSLGTDGTDFIPRFGTAANVGGVVTASNKNEFKYTAYKKRDRTVSITGSNPDLYSDTGFIEGRTIHYINGLQELKDSYLELYTGVTIIKSGVSALISGGPPVNTTTKDLNL
jgi:hypothetical protein